MAATDVAVCLPVLQQCHQRVKYVKEIVYYYNTHKGDDTFERKKEQKDNQKKVRQKDKYQPL